MANGRDDDSRFVHDLEKRDAARGAEGDDQLAQKRAHTDLQLNGNRSSIYDTMYAPAPVDSSFPSAPRNSIRVDATREPRRITCARSTKLSPMPGRR